MHEIKHSHTKLWSHQERSTKDHDVRLTTKSKVYVPTDVPMIQGLGYGKKNSNNYY